MFHRTSRRLTLTDIGRMVSGRAAQLLADGEAVEAAACEQATRPRGPVRLAAPMSFGIGHLGPILPEFLALYPEITLDISLSDQLIDVVGDGFDLVLRIAALANSSLRARTLCQVQRPLVGAPAYFERYGRPNHPSDLKNHIGLSYSYISPPDQWRFRNLAGEEIAVTPASPLRVNNGDILRPALLAGIGIAILPEFLVWEDLAAGRLIGVMQEWEPMSVALHLVTPPSLLRPDSGGVVDRFPGSAFLGAALGEIQARHGAGEDDVDAMTHLVRFGGLASAKISSTMVPDDHSSFRLRYAMVAPDTQNAVPDSPFIFARPA